ncbi:MAG: FeoA family protein [Rhodospirillaceae bacterium]|nr:FeoA family protein [Rhodospirillaceae bacterium]
MTLNARQTVPLGTLKVGDTARVVAFRNADRSYREKLLAFGLTPGTLVSVERTAPLGDPLELRVRGFALSLRRGEADAVAVERVTP